MSLLGWLKALRKREDEAALERAEERQLESPEERRLYEGGIDAVRADARAGQAFREAADEPEHLAERDDE
jgi:hypothetical protein